MEDRQIVELYWQRNGEAIRKTEEKYGPYCYSISYNILHSQEDAEECINDTWLHTWNSIPPQRPQYLSLFLAKITRNLSFNRWNSHSAEKRGGGELPLVLEELSECIAASSNVEQALEVQELSESVRRFLRKLPTQDTNIFLRRCFYTESISQIAARYGFSKNYVSVRLSRTRAKLKKHLIKEGFFCER